MILIRLPFSLLLLIYQSAFLALGQIWANKVRSILTTIGIVIGVASVTAVIAALTGLQTRVLSEFESFGTNKIFIFPSTGGNRFISYYRYRFHNEQFEGLLEHCPSVSDFTRVMRGRIDSIAYGTRNEPNVDVTGIDPAWHKIENRSVILGRQFSLVDVEQGRPVCLINEKTRDKLGMSIDCIGQSLMVGQTRFLIVGLIETRNESSMFGGDREGLEVFLPFTALQRLQPYSGFSVVAASRSPDVSEEARAEIGFFLRKTRRIRFGDPDTFRVEAVQEFVDRFRTVAQTITMAATGVVGISLLVGGVGIMNIMLVSVSERTREIGLRKAVGARPSAILLQFLVEAVMLCFFGGAIGLLAGYGLTSAVKSIPQAHLEKAYIPAWAVALSFGFAAAVGLIFGMFPAIKAARLDPIEALRHE
ncbi:MAG TPA: ABC transporter permease [Tepidisphaeraceae bacterium]